MTDIDLVGQQVMDIIQRGPEASGDRQQVSEVLHLMHDTIDYYIRFYLGQARIFEHHEQFRDYYHDIYLKCTILVGKICREWTDANYNRIKRYINKSISGWVHNALYLVKKKQIVLVIDTAAVMSQYGIANEYGAVDCAADIATVENHISSSLPRFFELVHAIEGDDVYTSKDKLAGRFRSAVMYEYVRSGRIMSVDEYFCKLTGAIFNKESTVE